MILSDTKDIVNARPKSSSRLLAETDPYTRTFDTRRSCDKSSRVYS